MRRDIEMCPASYPFILEKIMPEKTTEELYAEIRSAHEKLVWKASPILWATDGTLATAVRHIEEYVRRLEAGHDTEHVLKVVKAHTVKGANTCSCGMTLDENKAFDQHLSEEIVNMLNTDLSPIFFPKNR